MEGWIKVFVGGEDGIEFLTGVHGSAGCLDCHGGTEGVLTKEEAHVGVDPDPSDGDNPACSACHAQIANKHKNSVHATQSGYITMIELRTGLDFETHAGIQEGFAKDCASCHASCGDCHISQPKNVGGGLVAAHRIQKTPDMTRNCTACHGSRIGDEYRGLNEYASADVHWVPNAMRCESCHGADEMHGDGSAPDRRYAVSNMPECQDCHSGIEQSNPWHTQHMEDLSCQVCHSQSYRSCNSCHVGEGITGSSYESFKIGRNPLEGMRGEKFALLRHIPISTDTYEGWGVATLPNFADEPTWKYTSPHNIQRWTERTQVPDGGTCFTSCHGTSDGTDGYFLRSADLATLPVEEREANQNLIVPDGDPFGW